MRRDTGAQTQDSSRTSAALATPRSAVRSTSGGDQPARIVPRTDEPRTAVSRSRADVSGGTATRAVPRPRDTVIVNRPRTTVIYSPTRRIYNNYYYYYPRHRYPYGYGSFGIGYFYYDPYVWAPGPTIYYNGYNYGYGHGYAVGELRLQVRPRHAEVYVDGYYAGIVDDFDGIFQGLRLEEGEYRIEIVAPGYEPIDFDVRIQGGRKISYRGELFAGVP